MTSTIMWLLQLKTLDSVNPWVTESNDFCIHNFQEQFDANYLYLDLIDWKQFMVHERISTNF